MHLLDFVLLRYNDVTLVKCKGLAKTDEKALIGICDHFWLPRIGVEESKDLYFSLVACVQVFMLFKYIILSMTQHFDHLFYLFLLHLCFVSCDTYAPKLSNRNNIKRYQIYSKLELPPCKSKNYWWRTALRAWSRSWKFPTLTIYKFVVIPPEQIVFYQKVKVI